MHLNCLFLARNLPDSVNEVTELLDQLLIPCQVEPTSNVTVAVYRVLKLRFMFPDPIPRTVLPSFLPFPFLCYPTDLICRDGTPFEAATGRTAFIDSLLAEVFRNFTQI